MSDFERRLSEALSDGAEGAPGVGAVGERAQQRSRTRRRRRFGVVATVVALAVLVPLGMIGSNRDPSNPSTASEPDRALTTVPPDSWQTVTYEGRPSAESGDGRVAFEVPGGCVPAEQTWACGDSLTARILSPHEQGALISAGLYSDRGGWRGLVFAGSQVLYVEKGSLEATRRILASFRLDGVDAPSLETWSTVDLGDGITAEVPEESDVSARVTEGDVDCEPGRSAAEQLDGKWRAGVCGRRYVSVTATTSALADVVASTVRLN